MTRTVQAIFDGEVFRPEEDVDLEPNTRVRITVVPEIQTESQRVSFLDMAASLNLEGPPDWSARLDDYLYGDLIKDDELADQVGDEDKTEKSE